MKKIKFKCIYKNRKKDKETHEFYVEAEHFAQAENIFHTIHWEHILLKIELVSNGN